MTFFYMAIAAASSACLVSEPSIDDRLAFHTTQAVEKKMERSSLKKGACASDAAWTVEAARKLCAMYYQYEDETKEAFYALYKVTTQEVCLSGLAAAGVAIDLEKWPERPR